MARRLEEECICDLCKYQNIVDGCEVVGCCADCEEGCYCQGCGRGHSKFELAEGGQW